MKEKNDTWQAEIEQDREDFIEETIQELLDLDESWDDYSARIEAESQWDSLTNR